MNNLNVESNEFYLNGWYFKVTDRVITNENYPFQLSLRSGLDPVWSSVNERMAVEIYNIYRNQRKIPPQMRLREPCNQWLALTDEVELYERNQTL